MADVIDFKRAREQDLPIVGEIQTNASMLLVSIYMCAWTLRGAATSTTDVKLLASQVRADALHLHLKAEALARDLRTICESQWATEYPVNVMSMSVVVANARKCAGRLREAAAMLEARDRRAVEALCELANIILQMDHGAEVYTALTETDDEPRPAA